MGGLVDIPLSRLSCLRSGTATRVNASGLIETVAVNTPRIDYDPVTRVGRGLLIEVSRTNLLAASADIGGSGWGGAGITVTTDGTAAPDGTAARKLTKTAGTAYVNQPIAFAAGAYSASVFAKKSTTGDQLAIVLQPSYGARVGAVFDLVTGTVRGTATPGGSGASGISASMTPYKNGWYLCALTASVLAGSGYAFFGPTDSAQSITDPWAAAAADCYAWGAQLEAGDFPSSYIPTSTATVTRNADVVTMPLAGWWSAAEGTICADIAQVTDIPSAYQAVVVVDDGAASSAMLLAISAATNQLYGEVRSGGVQSFDVNNYFPTYVGARTKVALTYRAGAVAIAKDGVALAPDAAVSVPSGLTTLRLGCDANGGSQLNGWLRRLQYYSRRLADAELQSLTA